MNKKLKTIKANTAKLLGKLRSRTQSVIKSIEQNPIKLLVVLIAVLVSSSITIFDGMKRVTDYVRSELMWSERAYELLNSLSTEVHIGYFQARLGSPAFINTYSGVTNKEYVFVTKSYYVTAITDENDRVLIYSVTTRSEDFLPIAPDGEVVIGKTTFMDLMNNSLLGRVLLG